MSAPSGAGLTPHSRKGGSIRHSRRPLLRECRKGTSHPPHAPLEIEGAELANVIGSAAFVGWYNGHPEFADLDPPLDAAAAQAPNPGRTETFHRLNRREYANAVRDLFALEFDPAALLPQDAPMEDRVRRLEEMARNSGPIQYRR